MKLHSNLCLGILADGQRSLTFVSKPATACKPSAIIVAYFNQWPFCEPGGFSGHASIQEDIVILSIPGERLLLVELKAFS